MRENAYPARLFGGEGHEVAVTDPDRDSAERLAAGEYGATRAILIRDGSCVRLVFGRNGRHGTVFTGAVLLSPEAVEELKEQIKEI